MQTLVHKSHSLGAVRVNEARGSFLLVKAYQSCTPTQNRVNVHLSSPDWSWWYVTCMASRWMVSH